MIKTRTNFKIGTKTNMISNAVENLYKNKIYIFMALVIFIKTILFVGLLGTEKAASINIAKGFFSVPPYLVYMSFVMIILSFAFLFKGRAHLWALVIIDIVATVLLVGDAFYYRGFAGFLNYFLFSQTSNLDNLGSSIISMSRPIDLIFVIDIVVIIAYIIFNKELYRGVKRSFTLFIATLLIPTLYLTYIHYKVDVYERCFYGQTAFLQSWAPTQTMSNIGPLGYHIYDSYKYYVNSKPYVLSKGEQEEIKAYQDKNNENLPDNKYAGMFKNKNLLVIQVESLENFVIGQKIQGQEITPNINKLLKNSLYFNNYHENIYNGTSSDSDLMTNAGVYPVREGSTFFRYPNNSYTQALPKTLEAMGYSTLAIHPDKGSFWNWMPSLKAIGFQKCVDSTGFNPTESIGLGIADHVYLEQIVPMLENQKKPFYTFTVTLTSHAPFDLPEKYREMKLDNGFDKNILGDYFQSIHYTDKAIGNFLDSLDKKGILKDTVVVIYGDHTAVHKYYPDKVDEVKPAEDWWMHNDLRIPLIVYIQGLKGETSDIQSGQIDLLPTISYLMGVDKGKYSTKAFGKNLLNTNKKYSILEDYKILGNYSKEEETHAKEGIYLSYKMVRSNYFKGN